MSKQVYFKVQTTKNKKDILDEIRRTLKFEIQYSQTQTPRFFTIFNNFLNNHYSGGINNYSIGCRFDYPYRNDIIIESISELEECNDSWCFYISTNKEISEFDTKLLTLIIDEIILQSKIKVTF